MGLKDGLWTVKLEQTTVSGCYKPSTRSALDSGNGKNNGLGTVEMEQRRNSARYKRSTQWTLDSGNGTNDGLGTLDGGGTVPVCCMGRGWTLNGGNGTDDAFCTLEMGKINAHHAKSVSSSTRLLHLESVQDGFQEELGGTMKASGLYRDEGVNTRLVPFDSHTSRAKRGCQSTGFQGLKQPLSAARLSRTPSSGFPGPVHS